MSDDVSIVKLGVAGAVKVNYFDIITCVVSGDYFGEVKFTWSKT